MSETKSVSKKKLAVAVAVPKNLYLIKDPLGDYYIEEEAITAFESYNMGRADSGLKPPFSIDYGKRTVFAPFTNGGHAFSSLWDEIESYVWIERIVKTEPHLVRFSASTSDLYA